MSARVEQVTTPDGPFDLTVWVPEAGHGPGLLLIQEIYGVSDYILAVAEDLAALGYVVAAPDLFWRIKPGHKAAHDEQGLNESLEVSSHFDAEQGVADALKRASEGWQFIAVNSELKMMLDGAAQVARQVDPEHATGNLAKY